MLLCVDLNCRIAEELHITPSVISLLCTVQEQWRWTLEPLLLLEGNFDYTFENELQGQRKAES